MALQRIVVAAIALAATPALAEDLSQHPRIGQLAELVFAPGSASISPGTEPDLGTIAAWGKQNPDALVVLDGHADRRGPRRANVELSRRRAEAVRDQLVALGVDRDRIVIAAYGESGPRRLNNRRVVIWGTRAGLDAVVARTHARGNAVIWAGTSSKENL